MRIMGTPDPRQIDGLGGAHPLTSKVAVVSPSSRPDADVDYLFLQVFVDEPIVTDQQNCGNLLAGIGPFAVERRLVVPAPAASTASVRIFMVNTDSLATATFPLRDGLPEYAGDAAIDGVPGTAAAIQIDFSDIAGGSCGSLLPTSNAVDIIDTVEVTMIDNGMPVVVMRAADLGVEGTESPSELEANAELRSRLESIRLQAGPLMNLGDVSAASVPKLTLVSPPVRRRRHQHTHVHPASLPRGDRRARCGVGGDGGTAAGLAGRIGVETRGRSAADRLRAPHRRVHRCDRCRRRGATARSTSSAPASSAPPASCSTAPSSHAID